MMPTASPVVPSVSVIVPTRNESGNVATLVTRVQSALGERAAEVIFVDDSDDDTPDRVRKMARASRIPVHLIHREGLQRKGGLGSAVLAGLRSATMEWAVVMDGDLQHPPEVIPQLLCTGAEQHATVVVASRYADGGDRSGLSGGIRRWVSAAATTLAKTVFPLRLHGCSDPMSGFFAVRLVDLDLATLRPSGFKILLEIIAGSHRGHIAQVPFRFEERLSGQSKASAGEGMRFLHRLLMLRVAAWLRPAPRHLITVVGFGAVGASGIVVNSAALWLLVDGFGVSLLAAAALATQVSTTWNFLLTDLVVFRGAKRRAIWQRYLGFSALSNIVLIGRLPLLYLLVHGLGITYLWANAGTLAAAFAVRFLASDRFLFARKDTVMATTNTTNRRDGVAADDTARTLAPQIGVDARGGEPIRRAGPVDLVIDIQHRPEATVAARGERFSWHYSIHGLVHIASIVRLTELDAFAQDAARVAHLPVDIEILRGKVGTGRFRARARVTQYAATAAVTYQEHLGRYGSDFLLQMPDEGSSARTDKVDPIRVTVGPLLARSPHVLYTNVIEALLRFVLVSRGHMLLHSACLELDGRGVMLSALTDTGKTGTILRLLRETSARFLSDDMTVLGPDGIARNYPKQLTISEHTLRAVRAGDLSRREWWRLRVQSRLHSKEGRAIAMRMGERNLPIMSVNALTQLIVPPPKYEVTRLVTCRIAHSVPVTDLFVIARGAHTITDIPDRGALVDELLSNTDDAYGFPPFRYFAPALVVGGLNYEELRARERRILVDAVSNIRARRVLSPDFSWADDIPMLLATDAVAGRRPAAHEPLSGRPAVGTDGMAVTAPVTTSVE